MTTIHFASRDVVCTLSMFGVGVERLWVVRRAIIVCTGRGCSDPWEDAVAVLIRSVVHLKMLDQVLVIGL